jgi:hypothetical protein
MHPVASRARLQKPNKRSALQARPRDQARDEGGQRAGLPRRRSRALRLPPRRTRDARRPSRRSRQSRVTLEPDPQQAPIIAEIFHLHADRGLSLKAIAAHLNRAGGPPSPNHVGTSRNVRRHWAATTIRAMLRNPVYTGRIVWNRLDFASARQSGEPVCGPRKSGWSANRRTRRSSPASYSRLARPGSRSAATTNRGPAAAAGATTCSPAWSTAPPATSRSRCKARPARDTTTTPAPTARRTATSPPASSMLEDGLEPAIVTARITERRADIEAAHADLAELSPAELDEETEDVTTILARIPRPDQAAAYRADRDQAPDLRSVQPQDRLRQDRTPHPGLRHRGDRGGVRNDEGPSLEGPSISSGGRIRTCDLRVMSPTSYQTAPPRAGDVTIATPRWQFSSEQVRRRSFSAR